MAKNYTFGEAVAIIAKGEDLESILDLGRRFPLMAVKVASISAKAGEDFVDLMSYMPEYLTANKVNSGIKKTVVEGETDTEEANSAEEETNLEGVDFESKSAKELWEILGKAGKRKTAKSTKKADLVEACKAMAGADMETEEADEEEVENPYEGKTAMELFKECKKRGVKAEAKRPSKYYIDLLMKADTKATDEDEEDDWEADEVEEEKPKKPSNKADKPAKSKPTKTKPAKAKSTEESEESEDDGDDWDI